jgi:hypothetical protein
MEVDPIEGGQAEMLEVQRRVLAGGDKPGRNAAGGKGVGDGCKLDSFGPGANDQANTFAAQPSP